MANIELSKLWPFGKSKPKEKPKLSHQIELDYSNMVAQSMLCNGSLQNMNFNTGDWRTYIDGMARLHHGSENDGTVFAEVPLDEGRVAIFRTGFTDAQIKVRYLGGTEIITWGEKHTGESIKAPTLQVIRPGSLNPDAVLYTFAPPADLKPRITEHKYEKAGKLIVTDYDITSKDARAYCKALHAQIKNPVPLLETLSAFLNPNSDITGK